MLCLCRLRRRKWRTSFSVNGQKQKEKGKNEHAKDRWRNKMRTKIFFSVFKVLFAELIQCHWINSAPAGTTSLRKEILGRPKKGVERERRRTGRNKDNLVVSFRNEWSQANRCPMEIVLVDLVQWSLNNWIDWSYLVRVATAGVPQRACFWGASDTDRGFALVARTDCWIDSGRCWQIMSRKVGVTNLWILGAKDPDHCSVLLGRSW